VPGALIVADKMLDKISVKAIKAIASSDTNSGRRIHDMAQNVVEQITENIKIDEKSSIQIDESVDSTKAVGMAVQSDCTTSQFRDHVLDQSGSATSYTHDLT
jgi:hypothetical protein